MRLDELDYHLPQGHIAQRPLDRREDSRLLLLDRSTGIFTDRSLPNSPNFCAAMNSWCSTMRE